MFLITLCVNAQDGAWAGNLDIQGMKLPLVFHFSAEGCTMDSPKQGAKGIKANWTKSDDGKVDVRIPIINASYEGQYDGSRIAGTFKQNGIALPLTLTPDASKPLIRPQTPVPPFPYATEEVTFRNGEIELHGTLALPDKYTAETPVMVMVTGSGVQDRDEQILEHKPFAVIADALARKGIATLRFDDRELTHPGDFAITDHKQDALAAVTFLRNRFKRVGVLGHSEGGTIALMIASERKADFIVSLAGMAVSGRETILAQNKTSLSKAGMPESIAQDYCSAIDNIMSSIIAGTPATSIKVPQMPATMPKLYESTWQTTMQGAISQLNSNYMRSLIAADVRPTLQQITCPVLAFNGKQDKQVDCEANLSALQQGLTQCHSKKIVPMESLNHLMQHSVSGDVTEYGEIEETISPDVLNIMAEWINKELTRK